MTRRRFFPAQLTQVVPGRSVEFGGQLRPIEPEIAIPEPSGNCECDADGLSLAFLNIQFARQLPIASDEAVFIRDPLPNGGERLTLKSTYDGQESIVYVAEASEPFDTAEALWEPGVFVPVVTTSETRRITFLRFNFYWFWFGGGPEDGVCPTALITLFGRTVCNLKLWYEWDHPASWSDDPGLANEWHYVARAGLSLALWPAYYDEDWPWDAPLPEPPGWAWRENGLTIYGDCGDEELDPIRIEIFYDGLQ